MIEAHSRIMSKTIAAIVNPVSGHRDLTHQIRAIGGIILSEGGSFSVKQTERSGHATKIAATLDGQVDAVLVVGGDGTVREVAEGLIGGKTPIAILQTGTENLLARELNMPVEPQRMADLLLRGRSVPHDAGVIHGRRFFAVAGVGFDALCVHRMDAVRRGHITHLDYFWPIWDSLVAYDFPMLTVTADGAEVFRDRGFVILGIIPRYSLGLRVAARAIPNDGLIDVVMFRCCSRWSLFAHAIRIFAGTHIEHRDVTYAQCKSVRFDCDRPVPVQIDGDPGREAPAECTVVSSATRFLTGADRSIGEPPA